VHFLKRSELPPALRATSLEEGGFFRTSELSPVLHAILSRREAKKVPLLEGDVSGADRGSSLTIIQESISC
jgi:hypothetical protein